jgi:hypothetical protein
MGYSSDDVLTDIPSTTAGKTPFNCHELLLLLSHYNLRKFVIM